MSETSVQEPAHRPATGAAAPGSKTRQRTRAGIDPVVLALVPSIIIACIIGAIINPAFLTPQNLIGNILVTSAELGVVVIAEAIILIGGYFDLSLQSTFGFAPMLLAVLIASPADGGFAMPLAVGFLIMLAAVVLIGVANGVMISIMKLPAFIVTLAMLILLAGLTIGLSRGQTFTGLPPAVTYLGDGTFIGIPLEAWILVFGFIAAFLFMRYTTTGRSIYAMGGNPEAAKAAGIRTTRLTIGIIIFGTLLAAVAGLMLTGRIASATANAGDNLIFTVFAAAVIGGISLNGGRGNLIGAGLGVLLLGVIQNILILSNVPSFWINAAYGAIILAALLIGWASSRVGKGPKAKTA